MNDQTMTVKSARSYKILNEDNNEYNQYCLRLFYILSTALEQRRFSNQLVVDDVDERVANKELDIVSALTDYNKNFFRLSVYDFSSYLVRVAASLLDYDQDDEQYVHAHIHMIADVLEYYKVIENVQNAIDNSKLAKKEVSEAREEVERDRIIAESKLKEVITC